VYLKEKHFINSLKYCNQLKIIKENWWSFYLITVLNNILTSLSKNVSRASIYFNEISNGITIPSFSFSIILNGLSF
jgi:hypothetical protein